MNYISTEHRDMCPFRINIISNISSRQTFLFRTFRYSYSFSGRFHCYFKKINLSSAFCCYCWEWMFCNTGKSKRRVSVVVTNGICLALKTSTSLPTATRRVTRVNIVKISYDSLLIWSSSHKHCMNQDPLVTSRHETKPRIHKKTNIFQWNNFIFIHLSPGIVEKAMIKSA